MKIILFAFIGFLFSGHILAQDTIKFDDCLNAVIENSPRLRDKQLIDEEGKLNIENVQTAWYPNLNINGKVSYQSDVVSIDIDQPGFTFTFPEMPHEQFGLNLDMRQTIYDGGFSKQQKKFEELTTTAALQKVDVDLYSLKEKVSTLYFFILMLQENRNTLEIAIENLKAREQVLISAVSNGIAEKSDRQLISVEILKVLQSLSELDAARTGAMKMLSVYMQAEFDGDEMLEVPYLEFHDEDVFLRPELKLFDMQSDIMDAGKELTAVRRLPKVFAYGQAGVGKPGYNMLNDQLDSYYMVGAGVQWNIWDWNMTKRDKQIFEIKSQVIQNSKETFTRNIRAGMAKEMESMEHYRKAIVLDDKMLVMRMEITENASSKLDNGVIPANDYLQILNEESRTRINKSSHKLQLLKAMANYNLLNGTL